MNIKKLLQFPVTLQLIRFSTTGAMATLTHYLTVILLVELHLLLPLTANIIGFTTGFVVSFTGHRFWTFADTTQKISQSLPNFIIVALFNFSINQTLYFILLKKIHLPYDIALIIVLGVMALITFSLGKFWAFRK